MSTFVSLDYKKHSMVDVCLVFLSKKMENDWEISSSLLILELGQSWKYPSGIIRENIRADESMLKACGIFSNDKKSRAEKTYSNLTTTWSTGASAFFCLGYGKDYKTGGVPKQTSLATVTRLESYHACPCLKEWEWDVALTRWEGSLIRALQCSSPEAYYYTFNSSWSPNRGKFHF